MEKQLPVNRFLIVCGGSGVNLLGQLRILGFNAELQIDAGAEVLDPRGESRRFYIKLDEQIGAVADLLFKTQKRISDKPDEAPSIYLRQWFTDPADIKHINFLVDKWVGGGNLKDGLAQAPAIGGATITHVSNATLLKNTLIKMINEFGVAPGAANPLEIWVVSSTAGGTGEGVHRFVGTTVAEVARHHYSLAPVSLNYIRIGSLTYKTVNPLKTALNTLFGIAADAALEKKFKYDFPNVVVNWYYLDLPDVGKDDVGKRVRAEMVEMAGKAIMLPDLSDDLKKLLVNNQGSHAVVVRTGFWGRDFDERLKYFETLKQLVDKLSNLIAPDPQRYWREGEPRAYFNEEGWVKTWARTIRPNLEKSGHLQARIEDGWQFPFYQDADLVSPERREMRIQEWKDAIRRLIGSSIEEFDAPLIIERSAQEAEQSRSGTALTGVVETGRGDLFDKINDAHRTKAWCLRLLGTGSTSPAAQGLLKDLHTLAWACSNAMNPPVWKRLGSSPEAKAKELSKHMWQFVSVLIKVNTLVNEDVRAQKVLDLQLVRPRKVLEYAQEELRYAKSAIGGEAVAAALVNAADLSKTLDRLQGKSWLQLLDEAVQQGDRRLFRQEVLKGATGLTMAGLRNVLDLGPNADAAVIRDTLNARMGYMVTLFSIKNLGKNEIWVNWGHESTPNYPRTC